MSFSVGLINGNIGRQCHSMFLKNVLLGRTDDLLCMHDDLSSDLQHPGKNLCGSDHL